MNNKILFTSIIFILLAFLSADNAPAWIDSDQPYPKDEISENDEIYLEKWLHNNSQPADQYLIDKSKKHQLIIIGEQHNIAEHKTFVSKNLHRLYHESGVRILAWEFSRFSDNQWLNELINMPVYDSTAVLEFARAQSAHEWNSREHWDMIKAVWDINHNLSQKQEKMEFIGIDINEDLCNLVENMSKPQDSPEFINTMEIVKKRDIVMAENVINEIMKPGKKGIVFVGRCHDYTHHKLSDDNPLSNHVMGNEIFEIYGDKVFQVWIYSGWFELIGKLAEKKDMLNFAFDNYQSPFANILQETGWKFDVPAPFAEIARGFIYLKPVNQLTKNSTIPGFIDENLFNKYKSFYEMNYGIKFDSPQQLDEHIQNNRW